MPLNSILEYVALITLLTYPVSTCTAERSFSSMKRLSENAPTKYHDTHLCIKKFRGNSWK